jgi:hypothetical protein
MSYQKRKADKLDDHEHNHKKQKLQDTTPPPPLPPPLHLPDIKKRSDVVPSWEPFWEMGRRGVELMESVSIRLSSGKQHRLLAPFKPSNINIIGDWKAREMAWCQQDLTISLPERQEEEEEQKKEEETEAPYWVKEFLNGLLCGIRLCAVLGVPYSPELNQIRPTPKYRSRQEQREFMGDGLLEILARNRELITNAALAKVSTRSSTTV